MTKTNEARKVEQIMGEVGKDEDDGRRYKKNESLINEKVEKMRENTCGTGRLILQQRVKRKRTCMKKDKEDEKQGEEKFNRNKGIRERD